MGKFEIGLVGVMAFLILGILGLIATSPDTINSVESIKEINEMVKAHETESELKVMAERDVHTHEIIIPEGVGIPGCEEKDECYIPSSISITAGHSVVWNNIDTAAHTVTSGSSSEGPDELFDSGLFLNGATFEYTFHEPGSYDYFCIVHPWMVGTISVI